MADQLDMNNRDPNNMNVHVQVSFDDVLAEPEGAHSAECVWRNSYKCFNGGLNCCYKLLTYLCGLPAALLWGCFFACLAFNEVWCMTPQIRAINITLTNARRLQTIILSSCCAPVMETIGMLFSRIHVTNSQGEPPLPLGAMDKQGTSSGPKGANVKNFK